MNGSGLHERLRSVAGNRSYRELGQMTGTNPETVRRYMTGQAPSVEFLASVSAVFGVNANWLLMGHGPVRTGDVKPHALREADPSELLAAMADTIETLIDRVDRIERFVQTMETRLRQHTPRGNEHDQQCATKSARSPIDYIADALPQRAPADAGRASASDGA